MKIILSQTFPLGRFHATPWKVFPYDDPHGEWPPSPWRFLRAILARSHQLERESEAANDPARESLVRAFSQSDIHWHLPDFTWRGPGLRQYQPAEFKKMPAAAKEPGMFTYNTTKVQDNFWLTAGEEPLYWILDGEHWKKATINLLDACLARMTYFGRAESITVIRRVSETEAGLPEKLNCILSSANTVDSVPVLCPRPAVTLEQLQLTTDDKAVRNSTVPPGAIWKFARRPPRPAAGPRVRRASPQLPPVRVLQFALGSRVAPTLNHIALIANWFRGRAVKIFLEDECCVPKGDWQKADVSQREAVALLAGKSADKEKLNGHKHAHFGLYLDPKTRQPTRLIAWKVTPFTAAEQQAIHRAASIPFSLGYRGKSTKGQTADKRDPWKVHCVPLDSAVPLPPGFDPSQTFLEWESLTPFVPPRHAFDRRGKSKVGEEPLKQLHSELTRSGLKPVTITPLDRNNRPISEDRPQDGEWVKVHESKKRTNGASNRDKRGFRFRLTFLEPVSGPIALGHSSHFGLGLFVPVPDSAATASL